MSSRGPGGGDASSPEPSGWARAVLVRALRRRHRVQRRRARPSSRPSGLPRHRRRLPALRRPRHRHRRPCLQRPASNGPSADRYADGIAKAVDSEPVLRGTAALARAAAATDTTRRSSSVAGSPNVPGSYRASVRSDRRSARGRTISIQAWSQRRRRVVARVPGSRDVPLRPHGTVVTGVVARVEVPDPRCPRAGPLPPCLTGRCSSSRSSGPGDAATAPRPIGRRRRSCARDGAARRDARTGLRLVAPRTFLPPRSRS